MPVAPDEGARPHDGPEADAGNSEKPPSLRQKQILEAYLRTPVAAQVARDTGMSERNVRRILHTFEPLLDRMRHERDLEQTQRARARMDLAQEWADGALPLALEQLGSLLVSEDKTAVQAIKLTFDLAFRLPTPTPRAGPAPAIPVTEASRRAADLLRQLATEPGDREEKGAPDGK